MIFYINVKTGKWPITAQEIMAENPLTSFGVPFVAPSDYAPLVDGPRPAFDTDLQQLAEVRPALVDGAWTRQWVVQALPEPVAAQNRIASVTRAAQQRLDEFARTDAFDGILSAASYATSSIPRFRTRGQYAVQARDATWAKLYEILAAVKGGSRPMPSVPAVLAELPPLAWPPIEA